MEGKFLTELIRAGTPVRIFTTNGFQVKCRIEKVGEEGIVVESDGKRKLIFYHAISTIDEM